MIGPHPTELVLFGASWCGPCLGAKAALAGIEYRYVDVDIYPEAAVAAGISGVPTLLAIENGVEVARWVQNITRANAVKAGELFG